MLAQPTERQQSPKIECKETLSSPFLQSHLHNHSKNVVTLMVVSTSKINWMDIASIMLAVNLLSI